MEKKVPGILQRVLKKGLRKKDADRYDSDQELDVASLDDAEIVTSAVITPDGTEVGHAPVLDIDGINVELIPSTTPGHYHLYIDKVMSWPKYEQLLRALYNAGIIEYEFLQLSIKRKGSQIRLPWIKKEMSEEDRRVREVREKLRADPTFPDALLMEKDFSVRLREQIRLQMAKEELESQPKVKSFDPFDWD